MLVHGGDAQASSAGVCTRCVGPIYLCDLTSLKTELGHTQRTAARHQIFRSMPVDAETVLERVRTQLKKRGAEGIQGLARNFRICDTNSSGQLDAEELSKCFRLCKISMTLDEVDEMHSFFDRGGNGTISFDEFVKVVRGKMNEPRMRLVVKAFRALDNAGDGNGFLTFEDIAPAFNAAEHPDVKDGSRTEAQVLADFLNAFEGSGGNKDGTVTMEEWIDYYENLSSGMDEDDYFCTMIANTWSALKAKNADGEEVPAIQYVSEGDLNILENILKKNIYGKSQGVNEERTLKAAFKQFDTDGSGEVSFKEFGKAMELFGLQVMKPGDRGKGGIPPEVLRGLFDRYNLDQSESISYAEFSKGLFGGGGQEEEEENGPVNEQGGQNPWLPSLANRVSMDHHYRHPTATDARHLKGRSLANRPRGVFSLD